MSVLFESAPDEWVKDAACHELEGGMDLFFTTETEGEAKKVCGECPVRRECLEWALAHNEEDGVWGMTSPKERKKMRRGKGVQFGECRFCARMFSFAGDLAPSFSVPIHCSDVCKQLERRARKTESARRLRLGIASNGG